jgi:F-type H+-transporting ATPase subunit a
MTDGTATASSAPWRRVSFLVLFVVLGIAAVVATLSNPKVGEEGLLHVSIAAEPLFAIGPLTVTNSMIGAVLASVILLVLAWVFLRRPEIVPGRMQSLVEWPIEWVSGIVEGSSSRWKAYFGLITGLFLMILVANWIGLLPGVGTVGVVEHHGEEEIFVPFVRAAGADLNFTLGLAIVSFVVFVSWGLRLHGPVGYLKELVGEPRYMAPLMFPIHLISELSRLVSLSMRLFGNVFAGEVLLGTMFALTTAAVFVLPLAFFVPAVFMGLELLFGAVQALVFALLTMTYITMAIAEQQGGHGDEHGEDTSDHHAEPNEPATA